LKQKNKRDAGSDDECVMEVDGIQNDNSKLYLEDR